MIQLPPTTIWLFNLIWTLNNCQRHWIRIIPLRAQAIQDLLPLLWSLLFLLFLILLPSNSCQRLPALSKIFYQHSLQCLPHHFAGVRSSPKCSVTIFRKPMMSRPSGVRTSSLHLQAMLVKGLWRNIHEPSRSCLACFYKNHMLKPARECSANNLCGVLQNGKQEESMNCLMRSIPLNLDCQS